MKLYLFFNLIFIKVYLFVSIHAFLTCKRCCDICYNLHKPEVHQNLAQERKILELLHPPRPIN